MAEANVNIAFHNPGLILGLNLKSGKLALAVNLDSFIFSEEFHLNLLFLSK
jgi:hypothetical protein